MNKSVIKENKYRYIESGEGQAIIILHGLMGGLSNFKTVYDFFPSKGFKVIIPELPIYSMPISETSLKSLSQFLYEFIVFKGLKNLILLGNSMGGHIGLLFAKNYPKLLKGLILTGSSGLYENNMGDKYPNRENYDWIKSKTEDVFFDSNIASKELIDEVFDTVNDRNKLIRTLALAKSAIRHNMANDLPKMKIKTAIIWGNQDSVTPPDVAKEFHKLLPNSSLYWIDKCGHVPMMEHPKEFNNIMHKWLINLNN
tara:strand:- start:2295 stop:3059 length:765 start_codon:yes stop_codon:yes gene_type:complete